MWLYGQKPSFALGYKPVSCGTQLVITVAIISKRVCYRQNILVNAQFCVQLSEGSSYGVL